MTLPRWLSPNIRTPLIILISALVACGIILLGTASVLRLPAAFWIVAFVPGYALIRLLHFKDHVSNLMLAITTSLTLSVCISLIMVYTNSWSMNNGILTLSAITLLASAIELVLGRNRQTQ